MNVIPLQSLSDAEFAEVAQLHAARLSTLLAALQEHRVTAAILQEEARRRVAERNAIPRAVEHLLRQLKDGTCG